MHLLGSRGEFAALGLRKAREHATPAAITLATLGVALLLGCASAPPAGRLTAPLVPRLRVDPISIQPTALIGAPEGDRRWFAQLVEAVALTTARRTAVEQGLTAELADAAGQGAYRLSGELSLPLALPPEARGSYAFFRPGQLAHVRLQLENEEGIVVAGSERAFDWKSVRWTTGARSFRRARRPEAALLDATEKAVDLAVREMVDQLGEGNGAVKANGG